MKQLSNPIKYTAIALAFGVLAGCASQPDYGCSIPDACAPVHENYDLSTKDESKDGWVSEGADPALPPGVEPQEKERKKGRESADDSGWFDGWFGKKEEQKVTPVMAGETDVHDGAVFVPPKPHRVWLSHWKGSAGELNSGNYTYLTTPGYYIYMGERYLALPYGAESNSSGAAGLPGVPRATFTPVRPDQLGFQSSESEAPSGVLDDMVQPNSGGQ